MMDLHLVVADMITGVKIGLPLLVLGIMSPGPAILAISAVSIRLGRARGIMFAVGVSAGSLYWGILAALGLGGVLTANTDVRLFFQTLGGAYFLWLALKMIRSALAGVEDKRLRGWESNSYVRQLIAGFLLHVLNPKAMFVWMAVISVSVPVMQNPNPITALCVTLVCWVVSALIYITYATLFSLPRIVENYNKVAPWIEGGCGLLFVVVGVKLLVANTAL